MGAMTAHPGVTEHFGSMMMEHVLTVHDHFAPMRSTTGSVLPQEPSHRLLCRALELLGPRELGLRVIEALVRGDTDEPCGAGIRQLHALLAEPGEQLAA
jgi:hypothetical protein